MSEELNPGESLGRAPVVWEYDAVNANVSGFFGPEIDPEEIAAFLNRQGAEGWELVNTIDINRGRGRTSELLFLFKRPAQMYEGKPKPSSHLE